MENKEPPFDEGAEGEEEILECSSSPCFLHEFGLPEPGPEKVPSQEEETGSSR